MKTKENNLITTLKDKICKKKLNWIGRVKMLWEERKGEIMVEE